MTTVSTLTGEVVAVKAAEVAPEPTVTEDGTDRAALLSDSETTDPPLGAAFDRLTVQSVFDPPLTLEEVHASGDTVGRVDPVPTMGVVISV